MLRRPGSGYISDEEVNASEVTEDVVVVRVVDEAGDELSEIVALPDEVLFELREPGDASSLKGGDGCRSYVPARSAAPALLSSRAVRR